MSSAQQSLGLSSASFVDACRARIRALLGVGAAKKNPRVASLPGALWDVVCERRDRLFLLKLARLDASLVDCDAADLSLAQLARIGEAFVRLRGWVNKVQRALEAVSGELPK